MSKSNDLLKAPSFYLWVLPPALAFAAQRCLADRPELVEHYHVRYVFRFLSSPIARLTSMVPFSLTEMAVVLGLPTLLILLIVYLVRLFRQTKRLLRLARLFRGVAWAAGLSYLLFMLLHGLNYARLPVSSSFELPVRDHSADELSEVTIWLVEQTNAVRLLCLEDEQGVFCLRQNVFETFKQVPEIYTLASMDYPLLKGPPILPKGVLLSHYWSYTGITGMYMPLLVEANVNIDVPPYTIPETALHESAHAHGFAREDEAGFLAFLTGLYSSNPDFVYSVLLGASNRSLCALYGVDPEASRQIASQFSEAVYRDLLASSLYWRQFEGPIEKLATQVNDAYLQMNLQKDGVFSYGRMVDLVLAWYEKQAKEGHPPEISLLRAQPETEWQPLCPH